MGLFCSQLLQIIVLGHALIFSACENSESNISLEFLDTQVIKVTQLVYPLLYLKVVLICVSNMTDFYHNMEDSLPTLITWVHIDVSVLHFFLSNEGCSRECLLNLFHQWL